MSPKALSGTCLTQLAAAHHDVSANQDIHPGDANYTLIMWDRDLFWFESVSVKRTPIHDETIRQWVLVHIYHDEMDWYLKCVLDTVQARADLSKDAWSPFNNSHLTTANNNKKNRYLKWPFRKRVLQTSMHKQQDKKTHSILGKKNVPQICSRPKPWVAIKIHVCMCYMKDELLMKLFFKKKIFHSPHF